MAEDSLSLYFALNKDEKADLEVIAAAAIQWVEALRTAATVLDPDAKIRVEFIDADESSLRLNTILDWAEDQLAQIEEGAGRYWRLRKLAIALAVFIGVPTVDYYFGDPPTATLSEEDRRRIDELLERIQLAPEVEESNRKFFKVIERDHAIAGVGVSEERSEPPAVFVPRSQFPERSGLWIPEEDVQERTLRPVVDVVLVSPVLVGRPRAWTFQQEGLPEFKAIMKDKQFLAALDESHVRETLRTGIPMTLRLEVKEKKVDGDWVVKPKGRSVAEVISPKVG